MWALLLAKPKWILAGGLLAALAVGFFWYGNIRASAGYASGSRAQLQTDSQQFQQVLKQYDATLQQDQGQIDSDKQLLTALTGQLSTLTAQFTSLVKDRQASAGQVAQLPDAQVQADLESKLGGKLSDTAILRKDDAIVTDYPLVLKQVDVLTATQTNQQDQINDLNDEVLKIVNQRDVAITYGNTVTGYYVKAYNAAQKHHSMFVKILSFGLVRDKHLNLPDPETLKP